MNEDGAVDYGPLAGLIGVWRGDQGDDVAPEPDGVERNPFYETITFEAAGDVTNAESQTLAIVRYHQEVRRKSNDKVFHDQVGYWTWNAADGSVVETFTIPRRLAVVAGGTVSEAGGAVTLEVSADASRPDFGIVQAPFLLEHAKTLAFEHRLTIRGDELHYSESTFLDIYEESRFDHSDSNTLRRVD